VFARYNKQNIIVFYSRSPLGQPLRLSQRFCETSSQSESNNAGEAVKALTDVYCTIVFVISLRFVHNYLFEIHFFQRHRKNRMINKCAEDVVMSTVVCEKKLSQCCLSDLFNA
jgi:exonuclease I